MRNLCPDLTISYKYKVSHFRPRVTWGDQSTIEPISSAALKAEASERVRFLATPKRNHQGEEELNRYGCMFISLSSNTACMGISNYLSSLIM